MHNKVKKVVVLSGKNVNGCNLFPISKTNLEVHQVSCISWRKGGCEIFDVELFK